MRGKNTQFINKGGKIPRIMHEISSFIGWFCKLQNFCKSRNTLRNFLYGTHLRQRRLHAPSVWTISLQAIPAICKGNFFSVNAFILTSSWCFVHQVTFKPSEQLTRSFNWPEILLFPSVRLEREYSPYWIPCLTAALAHFRNLLAAQKVAQEKFIMFCIF